MTPISPLSLLLAALGGYLLGSIPFGLLLTRAAGAGDLRQIGSGNIGATNVLRTGNKKLAALTLFCDAAKGTVAVVLAGLLFGRGAGYAAGLAAFLGHVFPVWLKFRGGKGVATYIGVMLGLAWPGALFFGAVWIAVAIVTRYSSLSALVASVAAPLFLLMMDAPKPALAFAVMSLLVFFTHRANIGRLIAGTESRIGAK